MIDWKPIADIPADRKDGREVLLWATDAGCPEIVTWDSAMWVNRGGFTVRAPSHYADLCAPEPLVSVTSLPAAAAKADGYRNAAWPGPLPILPVPDIPRIRVTETPDGTVIATFGDKEIYRGPAAGVFQLHGSAIHLPRNTDAAWIASLGEVYGEPES